MNRSRSKKSKVAQTPLFIEKLIDMLEDSAIDHIIQWTSSNDSFHIRSISQFTETVLPRFFKHNNFSSFIRQLNMYGFRKIRHEDGENVYQNQSFKRGNRALLKNIKRKVNLERQDRIAVYAQQSHSNSNLSKQIQEMKTKQKDLQQICRHLLVQNHKLIEQNNNLMKKMKDDERKKERKIQKLLIAMIMASQNKQSAIGSGHGDPIMMIQDSSNLGNMLSLMTGQNSMDLNVLNDKNQQTPLEMLTNALSRNKSMKQFKQMLQNYYNTGPKEKNQNNSNNIGQTRMTRNRSNDSMYNRGNTKNHLNFTNPSNQQKSVDIQYMRQDESGFHLNNDPSELSQQYGFSHNQNDQGIMKPPNQDDDDGFISINDFMNLDQEKPIIGDGDNIDLEESN